MRISRTFRFSAAHWLPYVPKAHKCHRLHGHNYEVVVELDGPLDPTLGWVVDYAYLDAAWEQTCKPDLDHRCLNEVIANPTAELLAVEIWSRLAVVEMLGDLLHSVTVRENGRSSATYHGQRE